MQNYSCPVVYFLLEGWYEVDSSRRFYRLSCWQWLLPPDSFIACRLHLMVVICLGYSWILNMETTRSRTMGFLRTTRRYNLDKHTSLHALHSHRHESRKPNMSPIPADRWQHNFLRIRDVITKALSTNVKLQPTTDHNTVQILTNSYPVTITYLFRE
jgi:hypothetical protein